MKKFSKKLPLKLILLIVAAVAIIGMGSTYAVLAVRSAAVNNSFDTASVVIDTEVKEETDGMSKKVVIYNQNTAPVFIRAKIVISPDDVAEANTLSTEYSYGNTQTIGTTVYNVAGGQWVKSGDWYYYLGVVPEGYSTGLLMDSWSAKTGVTYSGDLDIYVYEESVQTTVSANADINSIISAFNSVD